MHSKKKCSKIGNELLFDDFTECAGFVYFDDRPIQSELVKQFSELVAADSSGCKTVLA